VNFIQGRGLNYRCLISQLQDIDAEYTDVPYHSNVQWLRFGKILRRALLEEEILMLLE
jgi:hypothetical protein